MPISPNGGAANFTITGNTLDTPVLPSWFAGIAVTNGSPTSSDTVNVCAKIGGSTAAERNTLNLGGNLGVIVASSGAASGHTFNLPGYAGGANLTNVQNFIQGNNSGSFTTDAYVDAPATAAAFTGVGTGCGTPLLAAGGEGSGAPGAQITQPQLDAAANAAIDRWAAAGLPAEQLAQLRATTVRVADLGAGRLGQSFGMMVELDRDAAGWGWFVDATLSDDGEFGDLVGATERRAERGSPADERMDLLTVVTHELGHVLGLEDLAVGDQPHALMTEELRTGVRRVPATVTAPMAPAATPALAATPTLVTTTPSSVQASVGTLPAGKRVIMTFDTVIGNPLPRGVTQVSNQARITATSLAPVLSNDPATSATGDPTVTLLDVVTARRIYLPIVARPTAATLTPDLVVTGISLVPNKTVFAAGEPVEVRVTVRNQGNGAAGPFWVDLYINPSSPPTAANQVWNTRCVLTPCYGMAWEVTGGLAAGQSITLSSQSLPAGYSIWPGYFAASTSDLYAYADSYNPGVANGAVAEGDEANNRAELHGLSVTGPNPSLAQPQSLVERPAPRTR